MKPVRYPVDPIVLVDDEARALDSLEILFQAEGIDNVIKLSDPLRLFETMELHSAGLVLLDLIMPSVSGESLLEPLAQKHPDVPVIVVTAKDAVSTAVTCMKQGAFDFIVKPVDTERLLASVRHAIGLRELRRENRDLRDRLFSGAIVNSEKLAHIVAQSPGMRAVLQYAEAIAHSRHPVLVTGETGVGKELVAHALHDLSGRTGPFVSLNVAGLDDALFADTLFGHVRGAFTGAVQARSGLVNRAAEGTLFLDEIGDLSMPSQMKLLRLVQEAEYFPVGSDTVRRAKTRIVAATNRDLRAALADGLFRNDLFFRLSAHEIAIPPLRKRIEDIPALAGFFLEELARERGVPKPDIPDAWIQQIQQYEFPGNARELRSMMIDLLTQTENAVLIPPDKPMPFLAKMRFLTEQQQTQDVSANTVFSQLHNLPTIKEVTHALIKEAMIRADSHQGAAAKILGISQQALSKRLSKQTPPPSLT